MQTVASHLTRLRAGRIRHHEEAAQGPTQGQTGQREVDLAGLRTDRNVAGPRRLHQLLRHHGHERVHARTPVRTEERLGQQGQPERRGFLRSAMGQLKNLSVVLETIKLVGFLFSNDFFSSTTSENKIIWF